MGGINAIFAVGVVAEEPKISKTKYGCLLNFTLACSESPESPTEYLKCFQFRKTDKIFFNAGDTLSVAGSLESSSWEDKSGKKQYATKIKVSKMDKVNREEYHETP